MAGVRLGVSLEAEARTSGRAAVARFLDKVSVQESGPYGRALKAAVDIAEGASVIRIPLEAFVAPEMGRASWVKSGGRSVPSDDDDGLSDEAWLSVYVAMQYKDNVHPQRPYMDTLPTLTDMSRTMPVMWDPADASTTPRLTHLLDSSDCFNGATTPHTLSVVLHAMSVVRSGQAREYDALVAACGSSGMPPFSLEEYRYAWAIVNSRNFFVTGSLWRDGGRAFLVPFVDLLNHSPPVSSGGRENLRWYYDDGLRMLDVVATRSVPRGEELLINYSGHWSGCHPLDQEPPFYFLIFYGFFERVDADRACDGGKRIEHAATRSRL